MNSETVEPPVARRPLEPLVGRISPSAVIDGQTVVPPGWMWVMAFAIRGVEWAVRECETEAFRQSARDWFAARKEYEIEQETADFEKRIAEIRSRCP